MQHHQQQQQQDLSRGRKRRNSEDEDMTEQPKYRYINKKLDKRPRSIQKRSSTRSALLDTMDKEALIEIINTLMTKQPDIRHDVINYIPAPTIQSSMNVLMDLEKKFYSSFPFNKNGNGKDDYTFSRVREGLIDVIDTINQYANHFTFNSQVFPSTCFRYLDFATHIAHRLPNWDNPANNQIKIELFQTLADFYKSIIQFTSSNLKQDEYFQDVSDWAKNLAGHDKLTEGLFFHEAVFEFNKQLGYLMHPAIATSGYSNNMVINNNSTTSIVGNGF